MNAFIECIQVNEFIPALNFVAVPSFRTKIYQPYYVIDGREVSFISISSLSVPVFTWCRYYIVLFFGSSSFAFFLCWLKLILFQSQNMYVHACLRCRILKTRFIQNVIRNRRMMKRSENGTNVNMCTHTHMFCQYEVHCRLLQ